MIWPWGELRRLRVELHAAKRSCSAEMKRAGRLTRRVKVLDRACVKWRGQAEHDQRYIDGLEAIVVALGGARRITVLRQEMRDPSDGGDV